MTWVKTFCVGFSHIAQYASPDTTGMGKQATINKVVQTYQNISDTASDTAHKLAKTPAPTFRGGKKMAKGVQGWFTDISDVYGKGAVIIDHGDYATPSDLKDAIDKVESNASKANTTLSQSIGTVDPAASRAMAQMPQCAALAAGSGG